MFRTEACHLSTLALLALLAGLALPAAAQGPPARIAVVDIETIVTESNAGKKLQSDLDAFRQGAEAELRAKAEAAQALEKRLDETTDPAESRKLAKELERATIELQRTRDDKQREGQKLQQDGLAKVERELTPIFKRLRDEEGWDLILARTPGVTLVVSDRIDLTKKVLDLYNAAQP